MCPTSKRREVLESSETRLLVLPGPLTQKSSILPRTNAGPASDLVEREKKEPWCPGKPGLTLAPCCSQLQMEEEKKYINKRQSPQKRWQLFLMLLLVISVTTRQPLKRG